MWVERRSTATLTIQGVEGVGHFPAPEVYVHMGINILTEFKVKRGRENEVIALLRQLLPESKKHAKDVVEEISIRQNQDDPTDIVSAQRWQSRKAYEDYLKWRTDNGYTARFEDMLEKPLTIRFFNEVAMD